MRYAAEHKQNTRKTLLKAAAAAIRVDGPDRVGVADVMAKAGLTHGGFYAHFPSKGALVAAAIGQMFEEREALILEASAGRSPAEALELYVRHYLSRKHRDAKHSGCPIAALASDLPRLEADARKRYAEGARRIRALIAAQFTALGCADAGAQADSMLAELVGALAMARAETDPKRSDEILAHSQQALRRRFGLEDPR
ncbi:TetR/AcrR family transcriptional regulator [Dokdonella sp.]|uniref:TetR/AcrR family transcriptional regulator n=1 Tax=Dokdonella sp. TaxID=2291710 RepID=UPI001B1D83B2|nr:TetR/AcrR family transcriptional regulator [Dokdonella sp.]MBO9663007.1 TetR/AcrR family transcriptional regulator [Dokdonella sp.]